jgi:hypothetical protein
MKLRVLMMLMLGAMALPSSARALDDGDGRWQAGRILVAFDSGDAEAINTLVGKTVGGKVVGVLPVIHAWQIEVPGKVKEDIDKLVAVDLNDRQLPQIRWIQPNYFAHVGLDASPSEPSFWPNDPYFWPSRFGNPNRCAGDQSKLEQASLWPLGHDLRNPGGSGTARGSTRLPRSSDCRATPRPTWRCRRRRTPRSMCSQSGTHRRKERRWASLASATASACGPTPT